MLIINNPSTNQIAFMADGGRHTILPERDGQSFKVTNADAVQKNLSKRYPYLRFGAVQAKADANEAEQTKAKAEAEKQAEAEQAKAKAEAEQAKQPAKTTKRG